MDGNKFDSLTRALGTGRSRRSVLKTLAAAALGALGITTLGEASAAPKCYRDHSKCTNAKQCCSGTCTNRTCAPADPCAGKTCDDGNECTTDSCSGGVCSHTPVASGTSCANGKVCSQFGVCNGCGQAMSCPPAPSSCQANLCDVGTNFCAIYNVAQGTSCDSGAGTCNASGQCIYPVDLCAGVTCQPTSECVGAYCDQGKCFPKPYGAGAKCSLGICDGKGTCQVDPCANILCTPTECMTSTCVQGTCSNTPKPQNTLCTGGTCDAAGICQPTPTCGGPCGPMSPCPSNCMCVGGTCA